MTSTNDELAQRMQGLMESLYFKIKHDIHQLKDVEYLADGQIFLLTYLCKNQVCKSSDIANIIGITSGAVTGMTDKLVNLNYIHRDRSEADRRVVLLSLTEKGAEVIARIRQHRFERLGNVLNQLSNEELMQTTEVFSKIITIMDQR